MNIMLTWEKAYNGQNRAESYKTPVAQVRLSQESLVKFLLGFSIAQSTVVANNLFNKIGTCSEMISAED